jgi:hypothetical protein
MADLEPIPLVDSDETFAVQRPPTPQTVREAGGPGVWRAPNLPPAHPAFGLLAVLALCVLHTLAIWRGIGGLEGLTSGWPIWRDDHPLYFHSALVTRSFLRQSRTTAGYDPSFMAGYAKSVIFPASSTLPELVLAAAGEKHPELVYNLYVLVATALLPWLVALAGRVWGQRSEACAASILLYLLYIWTDFPINYAAFGMVPYLLSIPLGLLATGVCASFLARGGLFRWLLATLLLCLVILVHFTSAMMVVPALAIAYLVALKAGPSAGTSGPNRTLASSVLQPRNRFPFLRHLGVWLIPILVLAANAFWWLPGLWLYGTKGISDFAFAHPEGWGQRLLHIFLIEPPIQTLVLALGMPGLVVMIHRARVPGWALSAFCAAGFFWGYLAGQFRALDFLQPGRHTYAFYSALALAGGSAFEAILARLRSTSGLVVRLDRWVLFAMLIVGLRLEAGPLLASLNLRLRPSEPFLSSTPSPQLLWVVDRIKAHLKPGERLLYEESGFDLGGVPDPFKRGRYSGILPSRTGVEVIGGPYLHASLTTNFTQFGEGKLFGEPNWDRDFFVRYARINRPAAILCWSPLARRFCRENPDLVQVLEDDGTLLLGKVQGFGGETFVGAAKVEATPGRLHVRELTPGVDGSVVLRYHFVPSLRARPPVPIEPRFAESDPVPLIGLRPSSGTDEVELEMAPPPWFPW